MYARIENINLEKFMSQVKKDYFELMMEDIFNPPQQDRDLIENDQKSYEEENHG